MRKLVIGCGYVGKRVAAKWSAAGDEVFALTRSSERAEEFRNHGWLPVLGDVTQAASLQNLPDVDVVLFAVGFDRTSGFSQREIYVGGLKNALEALAHRVGKWLYVSSTSVYGQQTGEWIDETSPCQPTRANGQICREAEELLDHFFPPAERSHHANVLRLAGIYGPGRLLRRLSDLKTGLLISGDPEGWLNLIHVDDAVGTILACEQRGKPGAVYLVSDDQPVRRREYFSFLAELAGVDLPPFENAPDSVTTPFVPPQSRYSEGLGKRCSNRKIREELHVNLSYPTIREGLPQAMGCHSEDFDL